MENTKLEIKKGNIDDLVLQAKQIAGLLQVFEIFISDEENEDIMPCAFECVTDLAYKHYDDCENLLNKLFEINED